jgi:hypothetical protein
MRHLTVISTAIFLGGLSTVAAAPYPPDGWAGEALWSVLAFSAVVMILALETDFG